MTRSTPLAITVPAIDAELDVSAVQRFGNGEDGRLIAISYKHESFYPHLSGPVLHFRLPDGRVVLTEPNPDGYDLVWEADQEPATIDPGAHEVLHMMWDNVNTAVLDVLSAKFGDAAVKALAESLGAS
ncbi:hypothetical protein ALI22I_20280 [Saccharothrix sp. ALI-22-I]|uniref:hypothetical protein n=1 Tax=Saccharothrix sp. ALI-22-I TaxID=1933778 RepID=UPI00097C5C65|nr:hypothetical protein [Saccharothrix sp. ALI-22-I]ONI88079.1 hypothetical protein ALI22I_20280 [Saccharothrix sp. ALI-22-I]